MNSVTLVLEHARALSLKQGLNISALKLIKLMLLIMFHLLINEYCHTQMLILENVWEVPISIVVYFSFRTS